jgi:hypothetical protein
MDWRQLLLSSAVLAALVSVPTHEASGDCDRVEALSGACGTTQAPRSSAAVNGDGVDVRADVDGSGAGYDSTGSNDAPSTSVEFVYRNANDCGSTDAVAAQLICRNDISVTLGGTDLPFQVITMADLESFRPTAPRFTAEPNGWAIVGMPANFLADAAQQVVPGELLGEPAEVRFTPVAYTWSYGDGGSRTTAEPGASWEALGLEELTPTPTSHIYLERGTVSAALTVSYGAEYRFLGPDWIPVSGTLDVTGAPSPVVVVTASTMLVTGDCITTSGPGC